MKAKQTIGLAAVCRCPSLFAGSSRSCACARGTLVRAAFFA